MVLGLPAGQNVVEIVIRARDEFSVAMSSLSASLKKQREGFIALTAVGGGITALGAASVKLAAEFEQTTVAFTTMLGSAKEADKLLRELADFARRTPFTLRDVETNTKQLLAMGIEVEDVLPTLKALGDVSAGLSVPLERLAFNFGQVRAQGRLTGVELRDFARAGVPLIEELAKNLGVTEDQIKEMVAAGEIGFEDVRKAFITMSSEGGKFFNLMEKQAETTAGRFSRLTDSLEILGRTIGNIFIPPLAKALEIITPLAEKVGEWAEKHPTLTKVIVITTAAVGGLLAVAGALGVVLPFIAAGLTSLGLAGFAAGAPFLALTAIIAGIVTILILSIKVVNEVKKNWMLLVVALSKNLTDFEVAWMKIWQNIGNFFIKIWNKIVDAAETSINLVIKGINLLIRAFNAVAGFLGMGKIGEIAPISLGGLRAQLIDMSDEIFNAQKKHAELAFKVANLQKIQAEQAAKATEELQKQNRELSEQEKIVQQLKGFKIIRSPTGEVDIFNPKSFKTQGYLEPFGEFQTEFALQQAKLGGGVEVNIENIYGVDPEEISRALKEALATKVSI